MKNKTSILAVPAFLGLFLFNNPLLKAQSRTEYLLDKGWKFSKGDVQNGAVASLNDSKWQQVTIPHDWAITGPFNGNNDAQTVKIEQNGETEATLKSGRTGGLPFIGTGWYRLKLKVPAFNNNKTAELVFDGAMSNAKVFVNGKEVGVWPYGYNSFHFDVSKYLTAGAENTLAVRLENMPEASRWYPGAGLYRNVHLVVTNKAHIPVWGTYVTTPVVEQGFAKVAIKTNVDFSGGGFKSLKLVTEIQNPQGKKVGETTSTLAETDQNTFSQEAVVKAPQLWSPETPALYTAVTKLYDNGQVVDEYRTTFGIRTIKYEPVKGFSLNGVYRKFKGVCNHHDLGPLGAAVNKSALRRQLAILKDMGCDAIRTSHNMPAPELVELCDEMGFMMMVESFDEWKKPKVKNGYSRFFDEWSERDMVNMVHRDRNHPSVVMWSIGNEIPDQDTKGGNKIAKYLQDICHREDPTRPVTAGLNHYEASMKNNFASILDIPGFNYKPELYSDAYNRLPQGFLLGSETASTVSSRGVYKFPVEFYKEKKYSDNQSSSYDFEACPWSQVPDDEFVKQDELQYVIGEFVWTGFDYLGEPTPYDEKWPSHSSYFGIVDLAGLPKDRFYLYRSRWNTTKPTMHILPHWTWPGREGELTPVFFYTNYPTAELFVNGKSMGKQTKSNTNNQTRYRLMWRDVKYTPGTIKIVAYDAQGKAVAEEQVKTAGKPHHIELVSDRQSIDADGKDIAFVTAKVCDANGNLCPEATNQLTFKVNGAGSFKAVANGDATNLQPFQNPEMKAFSGQLVVLVQSAEKAGNIQLQVASKGLKAGVIKIASK